MSNVEGMLIPLGITAEDKTLTPSDNTYYVIVQFDYRGQVVETADDEDIYFKECLTDDPTIPADCRKIDKHSTPVRTGVHTYHGKAPHKPHCHQFENFQFDFSCLPIVAGDYTRSFKVNCQGGEHICTLRLHVD